MKYIHTTATTVRKLKQQAKSLSKSSNIPLNQALDSVSKEAGYEDFHHVTEMLHKWLTEEGLSSAGPSHFIDMPHPGRLIFDWLGANYRVAFNEIRDRNWLNLQPNETIDWSKQPADTMGMIGRNLSEYLVAECSLTIGSRIVRIGQLVLNESSDLLSPVQRQYVQELMQTTIRPYLVSSVIPGESITLVDLLNDDSMPIRVSAKNLSSRPVKGVSFGLRVLQAKSRPYLSGAIWAFHPASAGALIAAARRANPKSSYGKKDSLSATIIRFFLADVFGAPTMNLSHAATGEEVLLTTLTYEVRNLQTFLNRMQREVDVEQSGELSFIHYVSGGRKGRYVAASINGKSASHSVELFTETAALASSQKAWFESIAGDAVKFLKGEQQTPTDVVRSTSKEEFEELQRKNQEQISPQLSSDIFQSFVLEQYKNWVDEPVPMFDNRTPRELCATPQGKERVRGLLELFEANEREMAVRMKRPCISYKFLWDQVGL